LINISININKQGNRAILLKTNPPIFYSPNLLYLFKKEKLGCENLKIIKKVKKHMERKKLIKEINKDFEEMGLEMEENEVQNK
jgi:hypothetical protein